VLILLATFVVQGKSAKPTTGARRSVHLFPPLPNLGREPEQASTEHKDRHHYQLPRNGMGMRPSKLDVNEYGSGQGQCGGANQRDDTSHNESLSFERSFITAVVNRLRTAKPVQLSFSPLAGILAGANACSLAAFSCHHLGVIIFLLLPPDWKLINRILTGGDVGVGVYLLLAIELAMSTDTNHIRRRCHLYDEGRIAIPVLTIIAALASIGAIFLQLSSAPVHHRFLNLEFAMGTILLSWSFIHVIFAFQRHG
jgi:Protein of unknown function (DUF1345)